MDIRFSHCLERFSIILNQLVPRRKADLDILMYVDALNASQLKSFRLYFIRTSTPLPQEYREAL